jgi:hypothetical protein
MSKTADQACDVFVPSQDMCSTPAQLPVSLESMEDFNMLISKKLQEIEVSQPSHVIPVKYNNFPQLPGSSNHHEVSTNETRSHDNLS